jgi:2-oxoglutarate ferredoxin oxidoreductase subunit gamma
MTNQILIAGFGGQGVLFAGKFLAYAGLLEEKQVSWLPSYGPEMRGGTANCSIIISDTPVGSPIVNDPDCLIVMNLPSYDKYEASVKAGGTMIVDSTLITKKSDRTDINACYIPATQMAVDAKMPTLANMILMGKFLKETNLVSKETIEAALKKVVSAKHADMLEINLKAIQLGYDY